MKVLLIRPGAIGDFILSLPALEFLRGQYTEIWCAGQNTALAGFADRALSIPSSGLDRVPLLPAEDVFERLGRFDRIHSWYGFARSDFREAVSRFPFRFHKTLPPDGSIHATAFYCAQVGAPLSPPRVQVPAVEKRNAAVIHPFASNLAKRWPLPLFRSLALLLERVAPVEWCVGPEEALPGAVRIPGLYDLAVWLAQARLYIGNDSGIAHLAAAVGTPTLAIFGPTDPAVWAPTGPNVAVIRRLPLDELSPDEVFKIAETLL